METGIEGLEITLNKVVGDDRGALYELLPGGIDNPAVSDGLENLYISTGKKKFIGRGGHYHLNNTENFFTIGGATLWIFADMREGSKTNGKIFAGIFVDKFAGKSDLPVLTIEKGNIPNIVVPPGIFLAYWPLSEEKSIIVCTGSVPYEKEKNVKIDPLEVK
ncbi:MAG TPA: hypothetical protein VJB06_01745, partial [archaeon]|nr:hypothetical protein [archaeon]